MALNQVKAPMHKNRRTTMERIQNYYSPGSLYQNVGLPKHIYGDSSTWIETKTLDVFSIPQEAGEHGKWMEYTKEDILGAVYVPHRPGNSYGPTWSTHWFKVTFDKPSADYNGKEIHFIFSAGCEAMVYDTELNVIQGIGPGFREEYIITKNYNNATAPDIYTFYVELACNRLFGEGAGDMIAPTDNNRTFSINRVDLRVFNREIWNLIIDFQQLHGMANELGDSHIGYQAMFVANQMLNWSKKGEYSRARELATAFFSQGTGSKVHTLHAMGHCHIDSAWLWPYDETIRKCARSFSAQLGLMEEYPEYKFVCSSAQQYAWVQQWYPQLFTRIVDGVHSGRFVPVGGTWIEMDGNIPNGEAFMRQYYYGQKFFETAFGPEYRSKEFWLPDTFGYSAQIPQMLKHVGIERFLTQKMSWSLVNKFPNHNFFWEGIDGTQVLVHFPPGDSYNMHSNINEFLRSENNSLDKGRCNTGVYLYGEGDGGGGPIRSEIEKIKRVMNVDGMPKIVFSDSNTFFDALETEKHKFYRWVGELYLELHNGTYTSQAKIKWYNRKGEFLFREVELQMAMAYATGKVTKPTLDNDMAILDAQWKDFLLNQFHDVLPGSCIEAAAQDAWIYYERIFIALMDLRSRYNTALLGPPAGTSFGISNSLPWEVNTVVFFKPDSGSPPTGANIQALTLDAAEFEEQGQGRFRVPNNFSAALVTLNPSGYSLLSAQAPTAAVTGSLTGGTGSFSNAHLRLDVTVSGGIPQEALFFGPGKDIPVFNDRDNIGINPGMFYYYDDVPLYWDAWDVMDYHLETRELIPNLSITQAAESFAPGPIVGGYKWAASFGTGSHITRYTILRADSPMIEYYTIVDWHEDHKMLKVEFPVDILSREATYEIQYGHANRPTHQNTSWEMAQFEVCGHKWMDISQADKGVTVITDSKYGWNVKGNHVQLSLLKSPKAPDANCDMHKHYIYYAVMPHQGSFQEARVIQKAYELNTIGVNNVPLIPTNLPPASIPSSFVKTSHPAVIVEAVKVSNALPTTERTICVRLYEAYGGYANTDIEMSGFNIVKAAESNGLEDVIEGELPVVANKFNVTFKPFQIRTFLISF